MNKVKSREIPTVAFCFFQYQKVVHHEPLYQKNTSSNLSFNALHNLHITVCVGITSPFSILLIVDLDTPESNSSFLVVKFLSCRMSLSRLPIFSILLLKLLSVSLYFRIRHNSTHFIYCKYMIKY